MLATDRTQTLTITPRAPLMLEYAIGAHITALRGEVWITQYGDSRDIVLKPGQTFQVELPACLVMTSVGVEEGGAQILLRQPDVDAAQAISSLPAWLRWLPRRWGTASQALMGARLRRLPLG